MNTKHIKMKVANMRKEQDFILYPYTGGDEIQLQSDSRFARVNLRTGFGIIDSKNHNYPNNITLSLSHLKFQLPACVQKDLQAHLWHNDGKQGSIDGIVNFQTAKLFSNPAL